MKKPRVRTHAFRGELVSPAAFRAFKRIFDLDDPDESDSQGLLVGVGPNFWKHLAQEMPPYEEYQVSCFVSPMGRCVLVLLLQLGESQCRMLFDIAAPSVRRLLEGTRASSCIKVLFHRGSLQSGILFDFELPLEAIENVLAMPIPSQLYTDWQQQMDDLFLLKAFLMTDSDGFHVPEGQPIREIAVTEFVTSVAAEEAQVP